MCVNVNEWVHIVPVFSVHFFCPTWDDDMPFDEGEKMMANRLTGYLCLGSGKNSCFFEENT